MTELSLIDSHPEVGNIATFRFTTNNLDWLAGQYQEYTLPQASTVEAETKHFFTIASAPAEGTINISTRLSDSPFKQALQALQPGQSILASGPKGKFTWDKESDTAKVLVAGGIGITPFLSMVRQRQHQGKNLLATLLFYIRDNDIPFKDEFDAAAAAHPEFKVIYRVGQRLTAEDILSQAPQATDQLVYLTGAEPVVETVGQALQQQHIKIKQDWFPGYTEQTY